jgi:CRISPR/Cas system CSM-associated protein Csm3 (group 7 of RAMP superfamily)
VGVDRVSRTASRTERIKFDLEVLPEGTSLALRLELDGANEQDERLLAAVLGEWQAGRAWLGGRSARGLGAFQLSDVKVVQRSCSDVANLLALLKADRPWEDSPGDTSWLGKRLEEARRGAAECRPDLGFVTLKFDLKIEGPFLTNDLVAAVRGQFDHAPLLDVMARDGRVVLPGSSLWGALRSHAERIARTLATLDASDASAFASRCLACNPLEASCDRLLRRNRFSSRQEVEDNQLCLGCRLFGSTRRGSRLRVEDAVDRSPWSAKVLDFLAIDRFTGGGRAGAKFDAIASWKPCFPVRVHLEDPQRWELGWLTLVLRDLQEGMIPIGFGASKGFGRAKVHGYVVRHGVLNGVEAGAQAVAGGVYRVTERKSDETETWERQQQWVEEFHRMRKETELPVRPPEDPFRDPFFNGSAERLYGKAVAL